MPSLGLGGLPANVATLGDLNTSDCIVVLGGEPLEDQKVLGQLFGSRTGALSSHQQGGPHLRARPIQLLFADALTRPRQLRCDHLNRLRRLEGQIRGLQSMIESGKDCESVLTQIMAAKSALNQVGLHIIGHSMKTCLVSETAWSILMPRSA